MTILILLGTILLMILVVLGMDKLFHYEEDQPLRHQMLLFWFRKQVIEHEKRVEKKYSEKIKVARDYWINSLSTYESVKLRLLKEQESKLNYQFFLKPLFMCVKCMPSVWGTLTFIILHGISLELLPYLIMCDVASVGIIWYFVELKEN